jgi:hypothetical protein
MNDHRHILQPKALDLDHADSHLSEMRRYIRSLVGHNDKSVSARNASLVFLTMVSAFQDEGLMDFRHAPRLWIRLEQEDYEVKFLIAFVI